MTFPLIYRLIYYLFLAFGVDPRDAFVATGEGLCLFACDYSQKEVRIMAHMSEDETLISLFR